MGRAGVVALSIAAVGVVAGVGASVENQSEPRIRLDRAQRVDITWTQADFCTWMDYTDAVFDGLPAVYDADDRCYVAG
jgi:hypothetical protein